MQLSVNSLDLMCGKCINKLFMNTVFVCHEIYSTICYLMKMDFELHCTFAEYVYVHILKVPFLKNNTGQPQFMFLKLICENTKILCGTKGLCEHVCKKCVAT